MQRRALADLDRGVARRRHLRRRDLRRPARTGRLGRPGIRRQGMGAGAAGRVGSGHPRAAPGAAHPAHARAAVEPRLHVVRRRDGGRLRPGAERMGPRACRGSGGDRGDDPPLRAARGRGARVRDQPHGGRHRPLHPPRRRSRDMGAGLHLPRFPLRRGRRLARPPGTRRPHRCRGAHRHEEDRLVRDVGRAAEPVARQRGLVLPWQRGRPPDGLSRSATSGSGGPATSTRSARPRRSSTTCAASSPRGSRTCRPSSRSRARCRWWSPT